MSSRTLSSPGPRTGFRRPSPGGHDAFSAARLGRLRATLRRYVESRQVPGLVALVHQRGREHAEAMGTMAFDGGGPMERDTIFRLASTTKPITAAGAMILVEECRLRLDDPVEEWLPELGHRRVLRAIESPLEDTLPARRSITVRDLLTFRSGYGEVGLVAPASPLARALSDARVSLAEWPFSGTPDQFMARLGELPLANQPGERWLYHTSAEILGVLIARASGTALGTYLQERIFDPLGMVDTGFHVPAAKLHRLPPCYGRDLATGELVLLDPPRGMYATPPAFESGAGGLVSTAEDLLAFGRMMLGQRAAGGECILSRASIELMTMDHLTPPEKAVSPFFEHFWEGHGWGLGLGIVTARQDLSDAPGRFGWDGAFGTSCWIDPKEGVVGVLMMQRRPDQLALPPIIRDFWTSIYQLIE